MNTSAEIHYNLKMKKSVQLMGSTSYTVPYDGCDTWIKIEGAEVTHQIRFDSYAQEEIQSIRPFIDKLIEIRNTFRK